MLATNASRFYALFDKGHLKSSDSIIRWEYLDSIKGN